MVAGGDRGAGGGFWAVKADIKREGGLAVSLSNVVRKAKSQLFCTI